MLLAKLNDRRLVELLRDREQLAFSTGRWCLCSTPIGARPRRRELFWVRDTAVAVRYTCGANDDVVQ